jgi:hypothetical protein
MNCVTYEGDIFRASGEMCGGSAPKIPKHIEKAAFIKGIHKKIE